MKRYDSFINFVFNPDWDKERGLYILHMANVFSKTEYHLTIPVELFNEMMKHPNDYDSRIVRDNKKKQEQETTII